MSLAKTCNNKKLGVTMQFHELYEKIGHFTVNYLRVCHHSKGIYVLKDNRIWKKLS